MDINFNIIDCMILLILFISIIISVINGFTKEVLNITIWPYIIWITYENYEILLPFLSFIKIILLQNIISGILVFTATTIAGKIIKSLILKLKIILKLFWIDKTLGIIFGIIKFMIILTFIIALNNAIIYKSIKLSPRSQVELKKIKPYLIKINNNYYSKSKLIPKINSISKLLIERI